MISNIYYKLIDFGDIVKIYNNLKKFFFDFNNFKLKIN